MKKIILLLCIGSAALSSFSQNNNPDCLKTAIPLFTTFDGFYLTDYCVYAEFGTYGFVVDRGGRSIIKEGAYRESWFHKKEDNHRQVSGLQILQNFVNAIKAAGGEVVKESDGSVFKAVYQGKELWIYVNANTNSIDLDNYGIITIEVDMMKQEVTAQDMKGSIDSQGKIALYGIFFDTGKSDLKPESEKAIGTVATYLQQNPAVNIYIVGHTDNVGDYAMNQKLSKSRSESVKNQLITRHKISAARMTSDGVGPICPITSNATEESRALNRRVEIVKK